MTCDASAGNTKRNQYFSFFSKDLIHLQVNYTCCDATPHALTHQAQCDASPAYIKEPCDASPSPACRLRHWVPAEETAQKHKERLRTTSSSLPPRCPWTSLNVKCLHVFPDCDMCHFADRIVTRSSLHHSLCNLHVIFSRATLSMPRLNILLSI